MSDSENSRVVVPRPVGLSTWLWVPIVLVFTAFAGQLFGVVGAALVVASSAAAVIGRHTEIFFGSRQRQLSSLATLGVSGVLLLLLLVQGGVPWTRAADQQPGRTVSQQEAPAAAKPGAMLAGSTLDGLDLRGRALDGAQAPGASFRDSDLSTATLRGADLRGADLRGACLIGADLSGVRLAGALVDGAAFSVVPPTSEPYVGAALPVGTPARGCRPAR